MATLDRTDAVFGALADASRRRLLAVLGERGEASATELARGLPVSRQAVQKQLGLLADAGLVSTRRAGPRGALPLHAGADVRRRGVDGRGGRQWDGRLAALERQVARRRQAPS